MENQEIRIIKSKEEMEEIVKQILPELKKEFSVPDGLVAKTVLTEIVRYALFENKSEVEIEDLGYDCSYYGRRTNKKFNIADYKTVGDFLKEPDGQTEATHMSGMGFAARTIERDMCDLAEDTFNELVEEWLNEHNIKIDEDVITDFYDKVYEEIYPSDVVDEISSLPFLEVVERFREEATQIEMEKEKEEEEEEKRRQEERRIVEKIHGYVLEMAQEMGYTRFVMENKDILWNIIERLPKLFTAKEITIYLKSQNFRNITSRNLCGEINRRWEFSKSN
jgi:hypothetical protein